MNIYEIILTGIGLSLDAVAVSLAAGTIHHHSLYQKTKVAFFFGFFQLAMPIIGWLVGTNLAGGFMKYGNIIGFLVLFSLGLKMFFESREKEGKDEIEKEKHISVTKTLFLLSVATSIDALVVGFSFSLMSVDLPTAVILIGLITFVLTFLAISLGNKLKRSFAGKKIEILGALILISLAFKILFS